MADPETIQRQREQALTKVNRPKLGSPFTTKVVGVSFTPSWPQNLYGLEEAADDAQQRGEGLPVILVHNPDNEHDSNAIQVHVPSLGEEWGFIGHLTRPIAARMAPEMSDGHDWRGEVVSVLIHSDYPDRPGISIRCERAPEEET